jgi:hypothetical protein
VRELGRSLLSEKQYQGTSYSIGRKVTKVFDIVRNLLTRYRPIDEIIEDIGLTPR